MLQLNWTDCDVRHLNVESDVVALIEFNRSRIKSVNDILNESRYLEKELKKEIGRGRTATKERSGKKMKISYTCCALVLQIPQITTGI